MSWFMPTVALPRVTDISIELLQSMGAKAIFLDVDNTLALHGSQEPFSGVVEWTHRVREAGFQILIMSNNLKSRVAPFAALFDLPFICFAQKPFPLGVPYAKKKYGLKSDQVIVIGDQVFTDILGANWAGMKSILLEPENCEDSLSFRFRRALDRPVRKRLDQKKDGTYGG